MRNDLIPSGAALLAVALLSRGPMTAPRALVAYELPLPDEEFVPSVALPTARHGSFVTHEVNLETGARFYGHYLNTAEAALLDFATRLEKDRHYLEGGIALTETGWLSDRMGWAVAETSTPEGA